MYVLVRKSDGKYVAPPGQERSYTDRLEEAWVFNWRSTAERHLCRDSEQIVDVLSLLKGYISD